MSSQSRFAATARLAGLVLLVSSCDSPEQRLSSLESLSSLSAAHLSGAALAGLGPDGLFRPNLVESPDGTPMITQARAKSLAAAYVRTFAPYLSDGWEKQRGGTLNLGTAEISPRVYLARSNYGAVPVQGFHPAVRRLYGSYFIVTFVDKGLPVLAVAVSAFNNDVTINDRGLLMLPPNGGNQFKPMALPVKRDEYDLSTPEEAAAEVAVATGAKVVEVPELVLQARPKSPLLALWEVKLDRNVAVSGAHGRGSVNALYVGYAKAARFHAADAAQPAIESRRYTRIDSRGRDLGEAGIVIPVRRGEPIRFSPAHISRED